ncbi:MAG: hypothetical protein KIT80_06275 [Chitinophagaceae bacterium]|nr:hypothetical protein [Chitinophagaceae bacterium]MCW5926501.1 hypothetical protein [Chitinophagaceae bacterium]
MRIILTTFFFFWYLLLHAADWTPWETIYSENNSGHVVRVQISFKLTTCEKGSLYGNSYYRINNEFKREKASIRASFSYMNCKGETVVESYTVDMSKQGIDQDRGKWFLGTRIGRSYFDVKYTNYNNTSSKQSSTNQGSTSNQTNSKQTDEWYYPSKKDIESGKAKPEDAILPNTGTTELYYPSKKELEQQKERDRVKKEAERIQQSYEQTQLELNNAKDISMQAYQNAISEGNTQSYSFAKGILEGASQISDPNATLVYTGVGLGLSLLFNSIEKKERKREEHERELQEYDRRIQEARDGRMKLQQEAALKQVKEQFITDARNINKYGVVDIVNNKRYMAIVLVPYVYTAEIQDIYFSMPQYVPVLSDGTYPLKADVEAKASKQVDPLNLKGMKLIILYPIVNPVEFINEFTKKMGSGAVINFNAHLLRLADAAIEEEPVRQQNPSNKKDNFWDY